MEPNEKWRQGSDPDANVIYTMHGQTVAMCERAEDAALIVEMHTWHGESIAGGMAEDKTRLSR